MKALSVLAKHVERKAGAAWRKDSPRSFQGARDSSADRMKGI